MMMDEAPTAGHDEQLDGLQQRFRLIVDSVRDYAIFMLDARGYVATWNAGAERIKGWRADEIIGQHFSRFYVEEEARSGKCEYELAVAARVGRFEDEGWRVRKDGTRFWANVVISRIINPAGELVGFAKVTRDLTQRRALEMERIARAAAEAELAERKKSEAMRERLLGVVGHDLRAPLSAIAMAASVMLKKGTLEGADVKMAARIARNADRMAKMISQLLDLTRARLGGGIPIDPKPVDLNEVCAEVVGDSEIANPDRAVRFEHAGDGKGVWDRERLAQVVANLVGNAVQYGRADGVVTVRLADDAGGGVLLTVHNDGTPIAADVLPSIFDPFRRGSEHRERSESLGLGLFIVDEIVRAHGGSIEVTSTEAEGTTFSVRLPRTSVARS
jgi:PAS domain S-box-containing protein